MIYVEEFVLRAKQLSFFCEKDISSMPNLKHLEIRCLDSKFEIDFEDFKHIKNLEKIVFDVDCFLAEDIERQIPSWKQKLEHLQVEFL